MVIKRELQFFPLRKNRKFTAVSRRRISRSFVKIKQTYSVTCLGFSACLPTVWIPGCSAILALSMMMVHKAIPNTMPFLFPEAAEDMVNFQINALLDEFQRAKENGNRVNDDAQK